jgi:hypothetical protein
VREDSEDSVVFFWVVIDDGRFVWFDTVMDESAVGAFDASGDVVVIRGDRDVVDDGAIGEWSFPPRERVLDLCGSIVEVGDGRSAGDVGSMTVGLFEKGEFDEGGCVGDGDVCCVEFWVFDVMDTVPCGVCDSRDGYEDYDGDDGVCADCQSEDEECCSDTSSSSRDEWCSFRSIAGLNGSLVECLLDRRSYRG